MHQSQWAIWIPRGQHLVRLEVLAGAGSNLLTILILLHLQRSYSSTEWVDGRLGRILG